MMVLPTVKAILPDALPLATVIPFTLMLAVASDKVGVTVIDDIEFPTDAL